MSISELDVAPAHAGVQRLQEAEKLYRVINEELAEAYETLEAMRALAEVRTLFQCPKCGDCFPVPGDSVGVLIDCVDCMWEGTILPSHLTSHDDEEGARS
jgi:hypothetical protein